MVIECSKRCLYNKRIDPSVPVSTSLSSGEQVCLDRCFSKLMNVRELMQEKTEGMVEMPPILYN
jgi:hypothetical protein